MRNKFLLSVLLSLIIFSTQGQITNLYSFSETSGTYTPLVGGVLSSASGDDGEQTSVPIGFSFTYDFQTYTTLTIGVNGAVSFTLTDITYSNSLASTSAKPIIAPLWDDLYLRTSDSGKIFYQTTGTAPNRQFIVEWRNISWRYSGDTVNFQLVLEETTNKIYFKYGPNYSSASMSASIGINDHTGGSGHFLSVTPGTTATTSSTSANNSISTSAYPGNGKIYVFSYNPPSCSPPSSLNTQMVATNYAILNWTETGSASQWDIQYGPSGFTLGSGTIVNTTNKPDTLTGLNAATSYDWYVRARCGANDSSTWTGPSSFTTSCVPVTSLPWSEGFENMTTVGSGSVPVCWTEDGDWVTASSSSSYNRAPHTGSKYIYTRWSADDWLIGPGFNLSAGVSYDFSFYYVTDGNSGWTTVETKMGNYQDKDSLTISIGTALSAPNNSTYQKYTATFTPSSSGVYYIGLHVVANSSPWYITFDDFKLEASPTCPQPDSLQVDSITTTTAVVSWVETGSATQWDIEYGPAGFTQGTGTVINVTSNPDTLTGLNPSTAYDLYVRAKCSATDSSDWTGPLSFTTLCAPVTSLPWSEGFENMATVGSGSVPVCWTEDGDWATASSSMSYNRAPHSGNNYVYTKYAADDWLIGPGFNLSAGVSYNFSFYYVTDGNSGWTTVETKMGNYQDKDSLTISIGTALSAPNNSTYQKYTATFTPSVSGIYYIGLHVVANYSPWYITFDDFELSVNPQISGLDSLYCSSHAIVTLNGMPAGGTFAGPGINGNTFDPSKAMADTNIISYTFGSSTVYDTTVVLVSPELIKAVDTSVCQGDTVTLEAMVKGKGGVFFSEYIEGSSNNKALEIYNATGKTINLDKYSILTNYNGNPWSGQYHFPSGATLASGDVFVLANQGADSLILAVADDTLAYNEGGYVVGFNGDDVRALFYHSSPNDSVMIDIIGNYNLSDPGQGWEVAGVSDATKNHTLVRKSGVIKGDTLWSAIAGADSLTSQYLVYPINTFNSLGSHSAVTLPSFAYLWNNGASSQSITVSPSTSSDYTVTVSNGICQDVDTVNVMVNALPQVNITGPDTLCNTASAVLDAGAGFNSYLWNINSGASTQTVTVDSNNLVLGDNIIWVKVSNNNGCFGTDTIVVFMDNCLGFNKVDFEGTVKIFPNPAKGGHFTMLFDGVNGKTRVEIMDMNGKIISEKEFDVSGKTIEKYNLTNINSGLYQIRIINNNVSRSIKIIVQ